MIQSDIKKIVEDLIETFLDAGKISLDLREKGLTKEIKSELLSFGLFKSDNKFSANSLKSFTCLETFFCERSKYTSLKL